ncbi:MAG: hypothetical protein CMM56_10315 [Rhodospirillaceae bacterium]|nr:hypothetical protein [Rhodospirillaceae bacterium]|tara:strand:+ start:981 stop:1424 length:444 start_codon:yes stop_codon:yes gene_type:complete
MFEKYKNKSKEESSNLPIKTPSVLGSNLKFQGELSADEDLIIQANVRGKISHNIKSLTVGRLGHVEANISAVLIIIEGTVVGDLSGEEEVIIKRSGKVTGNLSAPSVTIEKGATINGQIEMNKKVHADYEEKSSSLFESDVIVAGEK